jgi:hypothetical protein
MCCPGVKRGGAVMENNFFFSCRRGQWELIADNKNVFVHIPLTVFAAFHFWHKPNAMEFFKRLTT